MIRKTEQTLDSEIIIFSPKNKDHNSLSIGKSNYFGSFYNEKQAECEVAKYFSLLF